MATKPDPADRFIWKDGDIEILVSGTEPGTLTPRTPPPSIRKEQQP